MDKKCILTPTFTGHFKFIKNYLKSFDKYVTDKKEMPIFFIISEHEQKKFSKIIAPYSHLKIKVILFEDILKKFNIKESSDELLEKYGRFSFQSLKKLCGMLYLKEYRYFCVLDSESLWINPTNMNKVIDDFYKSPFITYSCPPIRDGKNEFCKHFTDNINYVLKDDTDVWFVEQFYRYWDSNILRDIVEEYGSIYEMVTRIRKKEKRLSFPPYGLFESVLYDQFVYNNLEKYGYRAIDMGKTLKKYLKDDFREYLKKFKKDLQGGCGISEHLFLFINKNNVEGLIKMCKDMNFDILRIEGTNTDNYKYQKRLLNEIKPKMLVCSQNHAFSPSGFIKVFFGNKYFYKFTKHVKLFLAPVKYLFRYITDTIGVVYYLIRYILKVITDAIKYPFC